MQSGKCDINATKAAAAVAAAWYPLGKNILKGKKGRERERDREPENTEEKEEEEKAIWLVRAEEKRLESKLKSVSSSSLLLNNSQAAAAAAIGVEVVVLVVVEVPVHSLRREVSLGSSNQVEIAAASAPCIIPSFFISNSQHPLELSSKTDWTLGFVQPKRETMRRKRTKSVETPQTSDSFLYNSASQN